MAYERISDAGLDYAPCTYGGSRIQFRGPKKTPRGDFVAFLGGTETYGRFIPDPFPDIVGRTLGVQTINLGCQGAGIEVYEQDDTVRAICAKAKVTVLQVMGAGNMSNRMYSVHPRRNDRFLRASPRLRTIYPNADFTNFHFTRHLLGCIRDASPAKFKVIEKELRSAWVSRMSAFIRDIGGRVVLLWMAGRRPDDPYDLAEQTDPIFVNGRMLDRVAEGAAGRVEVSVRRSARTVGYQDMVFADFEALAAAELPSPTEHARVAEALEPGLRALLAK